MKAVITIFKAEFEDKKILIAQVKELATEVKELGDAFTLTPKPGKLFELLNLLKDNQILYGTHFDTKDTAE